MSLPGEEWNSLPGKEYLSARPLKVILMLEKLNQLVSEIPSQRSVLRERERCLSVAGRDLDFVHEALASFLQSPDFLSGSEIYTFVSLPIKEADLSPEDVLGELEALKVHISISKKNKSIPTFFKSQIGERTPILECEESPPFHIVATRSLTAVQLAGLSKRRLARHRSMTHASATTSKQAANHVNIIFYHF